MRDVLASCERALLPVHAGGTDNQVRTMLLLFVLLLFVLLLLVLPLLLLTHRQSARSRLRGLRSGLCGAFACALARGAVAETAGTVYIRIAAPAVYLRIPAPAVYISSGRNCSGIWSPKASRRCASLMTVPS